MMYPSLPIYIPSPKDGLRYPSLPTLPTEQKPAIAYPKLEPMSMSVPMPVAFPQTYAPATPASLQMEVSNGVLLGFSIVQFVWLIAFALCNIETLLYLLKSSNVWIIIIVVVFLLFTILKLLTSILGIIVAAASTAKTWMATPTMYMAIVAGVYAVLFAILVVAWSLSNFTLGTNIALIFDGVIYLEVSIHSFLIAKTATSVSGFRYVLVPMFAQKQYQP